MVCKTIAKCQINFSRPGKDEKTCFLQCNGKVWKELLFLSGAEKVQENLTSSVELKKYYMEKLKKKVSKRFLKKQNGKLFSDYQHKTSMLVNFSFKGI